MAVLVSGKLSITVLYYKDMVSLAVNEITLSFQLEH